MKPRYIQGITLVLWGVQVDLLWLAVPMALILEARYFTNLRWDLTKKDFYQIADLTAVAGTGLLIFLFLNAREYHFITTLLAWLPVVFFPLTTVLAFSTTERMTLDIMFRSLRRQNEPVEQSWDMDYLLIGAAVLGAATNNHQFEPVFFPAIALIVFWCLFPLRTRRFDGRVWGLIVAVVFVCATITHQGIRSGHLWVKAKSEQLIASWIHQQRDPLKTRTALGKVGQLKLSDEIIFRIKAENHGAFPTLLHEASYDQPGRSEQLEWSVMDRQFQEVPHYDDFEWRFAEQPGMHATVYLEFERERALVPVPAEVTSLIQLPAIDVAINSYGAIEGRGLVRSPSYELTWGPTNTIYAAPQQSDRYLPAEYQTLLARTGLTQQASGPPSAKVNAVRNFFSDFNYSLYQDTKAAKNPLAEFLFNNKAGHCEYFATATTLMLRHLGIPARYVVGYSTQEYSPALGMYIVRKRHAHAWTIAWFDGKWQVVDTTPASWAVSEQEAMNPLRPIFDYLANHSFLFQLWWNDQKLEDYETELYIVGFILIVILVWRLLTSEQVSIAVDQGTEEQLRFQPGLESPLFRAEKILEAQGLVRDPGELWRDWLKRIDERELEAALPLHQRWRFDPAGLKVAEKEELTLIIETWERARENPKV